VQSSVSQYIALSQVPELQEKKEDVAQMEEAKVAEAEDK